MKVIHVLLLSAFGAGTLAVGGCSGDVFDPEDAVGTWDLSTFNGRAIPGDVWVRIEGDSLGMGIESARLAFASGTGCTWTVDKEYDDPYSSRECSYAVRDHGTFEITVPGATLGGESDGTEMTLRDGNGNVLAFRKVSEDASPSGATLDFERELEPGEYQVSVSGDIERGFEGTGASMYELGSPPFTGFSRVLLHMMGNSDALDGASFDLCEVPFAQATYAFAGRSPFTSCPSDSGRAAGGFIFQLGFVPQVDELDCYPNGYGDKGFEGILTITSITATEIEGEAQGQGSCSRHPHSEIEPMGSAVVSARVRFRAVRETP